MQKRNRNDFIIKVNDVPLNGDANFVGNVTKNGLSISVGGGTATGGGVTPALSGSNGSFSFSTAKFGILNGITFYTSNGSMVASHNGLTTARASNDAIGLNTAQTNVTWTVNSSGISFNASGYAGTGFTGTNATATLNSNGLQLSVGGGAGDGGNVLAAGTQTANSTGTVAFVDSNGITFGMSNNSQITASYNSTQFQSTGNYLTTAMASNRGTDFMGTNTALTANGVSMTANSSGLSLNFPAFLTTAQPVGAYLTTARASNDAIGLNTALTANGVSWTVNSSGLSLNVPAFLTTAAQSNHSHNLATTTTNGSVIIVATTNSAGATIAVPPYLTTAQAPGAYLTTARASNDAIGLNTAQTNVTWTVNSSGLSFNASGYAGTGTSATNATVTLNSNGLQISVGAPAAGVGIAAGTRTATTAGNLLFETGNGITFGLNGVGGSVMTASHNGLTTARASNDAVGLNTALTANGVSWTVNSSGLSLNVPAFLTTAQPVGAYLTTARASNDAVGLNTAQTNVTWTVNSSGISINATGYAGTGTTFNGTNISASMTQNSNGIRIDASVAAPGGGAAVTVSASNGSFTVGQLNFSNANNVTFGTSAGSIITASVAAPGAGGGIAISASNSAFTSGTVSFNQSGALTIGTGAQAINFSVPQTSSMVGTNGLSVSTNGSTIYVQPTFISSYENMNNGLVNSLTMTLNGASISHAVRFNVPQNISISFIRLPVLMTMNSTTIATIASATATASAQRGSTWNAVIYSMGTGANAGTLSSVAKGSATWLFSNRISITNSTQYSISAGFSANVEGGGTTRTTQYSISNTNYSFSSGPFSEFSSNRLLDIPLDASLSAGNYWLVFGYSSSSASAGARDIRNQNVAYSAHYGGSQINLAFGRMGSTNVASVGALGAGSFSTAGGGTTDSFNVSAISSSASNVRPYFQLIRTG